MIRLDDVTLVGVDCLDLERLIRAAEISTAGLRFGDVRLLSSIPSTHPSVVRIEAVNDIEAYNDFVITRLHDYVETSHALVIQHDGFVLNPSAWADDFLEWDYIGAPWAVEGGRVVGNGGFSLRSRRLLQRTAAIDIVRPAGVPEDWFVCVIAREQLSADGFRFAPPELAHRFSFEGDPVFGVSWNAQFGFHGLTWTDISRWLDEHPHSGIRNDLDAESLALKQSEHDRK